MADGVLRRGVFTVCYTLHGTCTHTLYGFNLKSFKQMKLSTHPGFPTRYLRSAPRIPRRMFLARWGKRPSCVVTGRMMWGPALAVGRPALPPLLGPCFEHVAILPHPRLRF